MRKGRHKRACQVFGAGLVLGLLYHGSFLAGQKFKEGYALERAEPGQGQREYEFYVEGLWEEALPVKLQVGQRCYREEEAYEVFNCVFEALPDYILGENSSLNQVQSDLNLITSLEDHGIRLSWQSSEPERLTSFGEVNLDGLDSEGSRVLLKVRLTDGVWEKEYELPVRIIPPTPTREEALADRFTSCLQKQEEAQRTSPALVLPEEFEGHSLSYRNTGSSPFWQLVMLGGLGAVLIEQKEKEDLKKQEKIRRRQMLLDYPEVLSRLIIFLGAGMSIRSAWDKIAGDYDWERRQGKREVRYVYEEMYNTSCQIKSGISESRALQEFGRNCGLIQYMKLVSLLEQNRKNGSRNLKERLKLEMAEAFEQRKHQARRMGEEAGTKLLLPLFMLLTVVMIVTAVPALIEFG